MQDAAHWFGPGQAHLDDAVPGTVDTREPGVQAGQEPAAVEMSPLALFGVVVDGKFAFTFRAGEASTSRVIHPHIDPSLLGGEINSIHLPRCDETQWLTVELGVVHGPNHASGRSVQPITHAEPGSASLWLICCLSNSNATSWGAFFGVLLDPQTLTLVVDPGYFPLIQCVSDPKFKSLG